MTVILFIIWLFASNAATTTSAPSTGSNLVKSSSTTDDVPCTGENPNEWCSGVWGN